MQTTIKKVIISTFMLLSGMMLHAQSFSANYGYDANGNRITASVTYLLKSVKIVPQIQKANQTDSISSLTIHIYPNPTHDDIVLEINGTTAEQLNKQSDAIQILTLQGQQIMNIPTVNPYNTVDLSQLAIGVYILRLQFNGETKTYRIVKE